MEDFPDDAPRFASSIAAGESWSDAAKDCLAGLDLVPGANLGFLYVTDHLADQLASIVTLFRGVTGVDQWVGTVGLGVCGTGEEIFDEPAIAALVGAFPEGSFRLIPPLADGTGPLAELGTWLALHPPLLGLVHADPRNAKVPALLEGLAERTGAFLVGAVTASRRDFAQLAGRVGENGVSGVLFGQEVEVATALSQGCTPIGPVRTVTEAEGNVLVQLDGRPALEVFKEDIGPALAKDLRQVGGTIFVALPIPGSDTGDYLVRNLLAIDPAKGWIAIGEELDEGDGVMFCRRDRATATADLDRMLAGLKRRLRGRVPKAGIYVSCVARGPSLFGEDSQELKAIEAALGSFPLAGLFAGGEISNTRLYGYTGVLTLFL